MRGRSGGGRRCPPPTANRGRVAPKASKLPARVRRVLHKGLQEDPKQRPQSVGELLDDLERASRPTRLQRALPVVLRGLRTAARWAAMAP